MTLALSAAAVAAALVAGFAALLFSRTPGLFM
jgi:hypothetical protein